MLKYERLPYNVCNYNFQQQNYILNIFSLTSVKYLMYLKCVNFFVLLFLFLCMYLNNELYHLPSLDYTFLELTHI